jgi:ubiquitin-like modifier-activating enzyme ATG7
VAQPADSTKDRTLDQQCTVTRPGLAPLAAATAVELAVALLHHPRKHHAPADPQRPSAMAPFPPTPGQPLGALPHQLRGFLPTHGVVHPVGFAFEHCPACNARVCNAWRADGFALVRRACGDAGALGAVSGLAAFQDACARRLAEFDDLGDDGDDF